MCHSAPSLNRHSEDTIPPIHRRSSDGRLPRPVSRSCPYCGPVGFKRVAARSRVSLRNDRKCRECGACYSPPTPAWGRAALRVVGLIFLVGGAYIAALSGYSLVGMFAGWARGDQPTSAFLLLTVGLSGVGIGIAAFRRARAAAREVVIEWPNQPTLDPD